MSLIISLFFQDDCSEEMKIEGLKRIMIVSIPSSFHHKVMEIRFSCLKVTNESFTVKILAKRLLMCLTEGYSCLVERV